MLAKNIILNIATQATVSDKNVKYKQSENHVNKGENHTKAISSPPKCKEMMEFRYFYLKSLTGKIVLSKNIKRKTN